MSEDGRDHEEAGAGAMGYQQTLMYGRYSRSLGDELREEMRRQKMLEKTHRKEFRKIKNELRCKQLKFLTSRCNSIFFLSVKITMQQLQDSKYFYHFVLLLMLIAVDVATGAARRERTNCTAC